MYSQELITGNGLTLSEALRMGGITTLTGLSIVFAVLVILMIVLMLFKVIFYKDPKKQAVKEAKLVSLEAGVDGPTAIYVTEGTEAPDDIDENELIAVLTAAVAASLNTSTYNLRIKSYRRTDNKMPAWNKAGVTETINNRF
ncbi:MAG: OadG family protein [Oscillospiraceae bacterium]|nr:OadG family protein [Oscillospiraceae bacterium]